METTEQETAPGVAPKQPKLPWYSLKLRNISRKGLVQAVLIALILASINIAPLWRLCWRYPVYSVMNFVDTTDAHGRKVAAWRWVQGREIRIYQLPELHPDHTKPIDEGVHSLLQDAGLNFSVKVLPMPLNIYQAYQASIVMQKVNGVRQPCISFDKLASRLVELRQGDPHADMLIVNVPIAETTWAHGVSMFSSGMCLLEDSYCDFHLGKHEVCHLVGYMRHDDFPLFVLGYPWEGNPYKRDTLMMLLGSDNTLSPRAKDALHAFWQGMEHRLGQQFQIR